MARSIFFHVYVLAALCAGNGCHSVAHHDEPIAAAIVVPPQSNMPRELAKVKMPPYVIEAPDVLEINAVRILPKPPYHLRPLDRISVQIKDVPEESLVNGIVPVNLDGTIDLGSTYDRVPVQHLTPEEAANRIRAMLIQRGFANPKAYVSLAEFGGLQQIAGEHLVGPDGAVTLGTYGSVSVSGCTLQEAKLAIETFLAPYLMDPEIAVDVYAYNSKVYYIVTQGAGLGDNVVRVPLTGNETVLDAISQVSGLQAVSSKKIWIARPTPACQDNIVLPVDWCAITGRGAAATNYQIMPGDRVFIAEDNLIAFDNKLAKLISPLERVFGVTLLGTQTAKQIKFFNTYTGVVGGIN